MGELPLFLRLQGRLCLVAGGGAVGIRKARALRDAGARVRLVSPIMAERSGLEDVEIVARPFVPSDLDGVFLAFAATAEREVNAAIAREARTRGILVNIADRPDEGDFILPAVHRRGDLVVSVGTGGRSPALAALVRDRIAEQLGDEWQFVLDIASALRQKSLTPSSNTAYNSQVLHRLLNGGLLELVSRGDEDGIDRLLAQIAGENCSLAKLDVSVSKGKR